MNAITPEDQEGLDLKTLAPANQSRESSVQSVRGEWRGSVQDGAVLARRFANPTLVDALWSAGMLSKRQYETARYVANKHEHAGFQPKVSGSYQPRGWGHGHDDDDAEREAIGEFRALLGGCSAEAAWNLHALCLGEYPNPRKLAVLRVTLDRIAKWREALDKPR